MPTPHHVLILHNLPLLPPEHADYEAEFEILDTGEDIVRILRGAGYRVSQLGVSMDLHRFIADLRAINPDVVFNLFEGLTHLVDSEATAAGVLDWLGIPYTGSTPKALDVAVDKGQTKLLLQGAGLPTPEFFVVHDLPCPRSPLAWPVIVKPAISDASIGIDQSSVVTNQRKLRERVAYVARKYGPPVLVERFVRGREFHINVVEDLTQERGVSRLTVLPPGEIVFLDQEVEGYWPIYSYDAKWKLESREYKATPLVTPEFLDPELLEEMEEMARSAFRLLNCRDFARMDVRVDEDGQIHILEVNPNPFLGSIAVMKGLEALGRTHADLIVGLVRNALRRADRLLPCRSAPVSKPVLQVVSAQT